MSPPSAIMYQLLHDLGRVGGGWPAYISFMPDTPDEVVVIYDTEGDMDGRLMATGEQIEHPGIMIQVRGKSYLDTCNKAAQIALALDQVRNVWVAADSSSWYNVLNVSRTSPVIPLGIEEDARGRRHLFSLNMVLTMQKM